MSEISENIVQLRGELQSLEGSLHKQRLTWQSELEGFEAAKAKKAAEIAEVEKRLASLNGECRAAEVRRDEAAKAVAPLAEKAATLDGEIASKRTELSSLDASASDAEKRRDAALTEAIIAEKRVEDAKASLAETERIGTEQRSALAKMALAHGERMKADREKLDADRAEFEASIAPREQSLAAKEKLVAKRTAWINETNAKLQLRKEECEMYYKRPFPDITFEPFNE